MEFLEFRHGEQVCGLAFLLYYCREGVFRMNFERICYFCYKEEVWQCECCCIDTVPAFAIFWPLDYVVNL